MSIARLYLIKPSVFQGCLFYSEYKIKKNTDVIVRIPREEKGNLTAYFQLNVFNNVDIFII